MATTKSQISKPSDSAAEIPSGESLSFSGLLCVQDKHSKPQSGHVFRPTLAGKANQTQPLSHPDFRFDSTTPENQNADSPAGVLFANGQIRPQSISFRPNRTETLENVMSSKDLLLSQNRRSSRSAKTTNTQVRNIADKESKEGGRSFGRKIFRSFATPCRNCRALEPSQSMNSRTIQEKA